MVALNLFPARVPFVDADGRLTPEAFRALLSLTNRVGGALGDQGADVFAQFLDDAELADVVAQPASDEAVTPGGMQPAAESDPVFSVREQPATEADPYVTAMTQPQADDFMAGIVLQPPSWGGNIEDITTGASPYAYTANSDGVLSVAGGTVSDFTTIARGATVITTGQMDGLFPLLAGDVATITYTVAPTLKFIPR